jgi:CRISPR-associated protein Cst2
MSLHVSANILTPFGTAANNRGETEGNMTTLQKLIWQGQPHTSVSAEALRFAFRRALAGEEGEETNRRWDEAARNNVWRDWEIKGWANGKAKTYIDDDLLGYMTAEAAKEEGEVGSAKVRRGVLEVTRAVSLTPWPGDVTFNAASPGATPSASKGDDRSKNPVPYGTEVHATRYQYGFAATPARLREPSRIARAINALCELATVAGNHSRFLFDFSPESVVFRLTDDPAPRLLYCQGRLPPPPRRRPPPLRAQARQARPRRRQRPRRLAVRPPPGRRLRRPARRRLRPARPRGPHPLPRRRRHRPRPH